MATRRRAGSARKMMAFSRIVNCHTEEEYEKVFKKAGDGLVLVEFVAVSERDRAGSSTASDALSPSVYLFTFIIFSLVVPTALSQHSPRLYPPLNPHPNTDPLSLPFSLSSRRFPGLEHVEQEHATLHEHAGQVARIQEDKLRQG